MNRVVFVLVALLFLLSVSSIMGLIQVVKADGGAIYINVDGSITPSTTLISTVDNSTYTLNGNVGEVVVERDNIVINGNSNWLGGLTMQNALILSDVSNVTVENTQVWTLGTFVRGTYIAQPGVYINYSTNIRLINNNFTVYVSGVSIQYTNDTIISGNNIFINKTSVLGLNTSQWEGITIHYSFGNVISDNNITNCGLGIYLFSSSENSIFHNNFIDNTEQVNSMNSTNTWNNGYPSGGNYWSDYNGTDMKSGQYQNVTGSDGIGDTPYAIDANNTDEYPLMGTYYEFFPSFFNNGSVSVIVISNSTIQDLIYSIWLSTPYDGLQGGQQFIEFFASGQNGSIGFCRVSFPTAIMNGTFHVSVNGTEVPYILLPCSNANVSYLYFTYNHSTKQVIILPEFPSSLVLALFMIATLLAVIIYKKKSVKPRKLLA